MDSQPAPSTKIDVYQIVTDQIISLLNQGIIPWQKPWKEAGSPRNLLSKRPYRGINFWLLLSLKYEHNLFLTWEQLKGVGGSVLAGEHGHIVVFWQPPKNQDETATKRKSFPMLRYYKVFNIAQCREIPDQYYPQVEIGMIDFQPILECEGIINTMPNRPKIQHKEPQAYYRFDTDVINMPKKKSFTSVEGYYSTLFHELVHSTGHESRLCRKTLSEMVPFGVPSYSMEELIAEMGSAFLCNFSGILPHVVENTVAYLHHWLQVFQNDKRFLIRAAGQAQKAADVILNKYYNEDKDEVNEGEEESVVS